MNLITQLTVRRNDISTMFNWSTNMNNNSYIDNSDMDLKSSPTTIFFASKKKTEIMTANKYENFCCNNFSCKIQ